MRKENSMPPIFDDLIAMGLAREEDIRRTQDGFFALTLSLARLLLSKGIVSVPGKNGELPCELFFDDWFLYGVADGSDFVYSLFKLREQEYDKEMGRKADGDTPGATVCFLAFDAQRLLTALRTADSPSLSDFNAELGRVVSEPGQRHSPVLKAYFSKPSAQAPYLIASLYAHHAASFAVNGRLPVPKLYKEKRPRRLASFLEDNNASAGHTVCDHSYIYIEDPQRLSHAETCAILATHTANTDCNSFAAEVLFHAAALTPINEKLLRPFYESAIRADMTIDKAELMGWCPYYWKNSRLIRQQIKHHGKR